MEKKDFILASSSPHRLLLLEQINMRPKQISPADIDETSYLHETPSQYVKRMAITKAQITAEKYPHENILACDTIITVGRRIIQKAQNDEEQKQILHLLSGRSNHALTAVCLIEKNKRQSLRFSDTRIIIKRLTDKEIQDYTTSEEWHGCSGYNIEGQFAGYVRKIIGSYTGIIGLPLFETKNLLNGAGIK